MGKKLIIKGADFSTNGFNLTEVTTDKSTLYYNNSGTNAVVTSSVVPLASAQALLYYENANGGLSLLRGGFTNCMTAIADCTGYEKAVLKTVMSSPAGAIPGPGVILFSDDNGNLLGGLTTRDVGSTSPSGKTEGVGASTSYRTFEVNIPVGATKVYAGFHLAGGSPFADSTKFELTLIKYELS